MKKPTERELGGMTVNERLVVLGLFDKWDAAAKSRNRSRMIQILSQCAMTQKQCEETTDALLANPKKYGF